MGPYGPNVATELEAALAADLSGGLGGAAAAEPPQLSVHGAQGPNLGSWGPMAPHGLYPTWGPRAPKRV